MRALEMIEVGDTFSAVETLLAAFEGGPTVDPYNRRRHCSVCGVGPMWPGELEHHGRFICSPAVACLVGVAA